MLERQHCKHSGLHSKGKLDNGFLSITPVLFIFFLTFICKISNGNVLKLNRLLQKSKFYRRNVLFWYVSGYQSFFIGSVIL